MRPRPKEDARIMFEGVDNFFIIPPFILLTVAAVAGLWQFSKHGAKRALFVVFLILVCGGCLVGALFIISLYIYFSNGGH